MVSVYVFMVCWSVKPFLDEIIIFTPKKKSTNQNSGWKYYHLNNHQNYQKLQYIGTINSKLPSSKVIKSLEIINFNLPIYKFNYNP